MNKSEIFKYIAGYIFGICIFLILMPFVIYLTSLISSASLAFNEPVILFINYSLATLLASIGIVYAIWSNIDLLVIGKGGPADFFNISISPRSKKLVVKGPYRYTRNPMVFGVNAIYIAFALFLNSLSALLLCLTFLSVVTLYLKLTEEKRLLKDFGNEYLEYKRRVSMIIPLPHKKDIENS